MKIHFCWLVTPAIPCRSGALTIRELTGPHPDLSASFGSLVPDVIGQDAHWSPVIYRSELSLKSETKNLNKTFTSSCPKMSGAVWSQGVGSV